VTEESPGGPGVRRLPTPAQALSATGRHSYALQVLSEQSHGVDLPRLFRSEWDDLFAETPPDRTGILFCGASRGFDDALDMPTYPAFLGLFYALVGVTLVSLSSIANALQLAFPVAAGFALVGPFVAIGLYEMSRRRELGLAANWSDSFAALRSPALPSILTHGLLLFVIFVAWIGAAEFLYVRSAAKSSSRSPSNCRCPAKRRIRSCCYLFVTGRPPSGLTLLPSLAFCGSRGLPASSTRGGPLLFAPDRRQRRPPQPPAALARRRFRPLCPQTCHTARLVPSTASPSSAALRPLRGGGGGLVWPPKGIGTGNISPALAGGVRSRLRRESNRELVKLRNRG